MIWQLAFCHKVSAEAKPISVLNGMFSICQTGNTRVIKQASLQKFQEEMDKVMKDPYKVVMKQSKLPMSLLHDRIQPHVRQSAMLVLGFRASSGQIDTALACPWLSAF